jgi:hypothetical protein
MYICLHVKYTLFWSDFNKTWIFSTDFWNKLQISYFMKICPVRVQFHADGRTDRHDEANSRLSPSGRTRLIIINCNLKNSVRECVLDWSDQIRHQSARLWISAFCLSDSKILGDDSVRESVSFWTKQQILINITMTYVPQYAKLPLPFFLHLPSTISIWRSYESLTLKQQLCLLL